MVTATAAAEEVPRRQHVIILVHGIRTQAPWVAMLRQEFENAGLKVEPTNYGPFDTVRFLLPIPALHRAAINKVWNSIRQVRQDNPDAKISFLAHSFGTFILADILRREFDFKAHLILFCGSVVRYDFPFEQISDRFTAPILNEVSTSDPWPALAEKITLGYGSAGTYGFRRPRVRDRWHRGFGHSQYLTGEFYKNFWIPFFRDGIIIEGETAPASAPFLVRLISIFSPRIVFPLLVAAGCLIYFSPSDGGFFSRMMEMFYKKEMNAAHRINDFERKMDAKDIEQVQEALCVSPPDGDLGPLKSSTRLAFSKYLTSTGAPPSETITAQNWGVLQDGMKNRKLPCSVRRLQEWLPDWRKWLRW